MMTTYMDSGKNTGAIIAVFTWQNPCMLTLSYLSVIVSPHLTENTSVILLHIGGYVTWNNCNTPNCYTF